MKITLPDDVIAEEINLLLAEAMATEGRAERTPDNPRRTMALAQIVLYRDTIRYLLDNDDWDELMPKLKEVLIYNSGLYQDAREEGDRNAACIALARMRSLVKLIRRLSDPKRHQLLDRSKNYHC
jgi:hypothetical protein